MLPLGDTQSAPELVEQDEQEDAEADDDEMSRTVVSNRRRGRRVAPHVRRFASEALAHLVRKAKVPQLQSLASQMFADLADAESLDFARGIAGVWLEVSKVSYCSMLPGRAQLT
jgi:U3 small nucleolar RNA-associated protein 20